MLCQSVPTADCSLADYLPPPHACSSPGVSVNTHCRLFTADYLPPGPCLLQPWIPLTVFWLIPVVGVEFLVDLLLLRLHHGGVALSQLTEEGWRLAGVAWRLRAHPVGSTRRQGQQAGHCAFKPLAAGRSPLEP